jgi:selenium-binding protein 1
VSYDISDPANPRLAGRVWLGGVIAAGEGVTASDAAALKELGLEGGQPARPVIKGVTVQGGPQMIQLSLDGRRLYATNSLLSPWDRQFYPAMVERGSQLVRVDVGEDGSLTLNRWVWVWLFLG